MRSGTIVRAAVPLALWWVFAAAAPAGADNKYVGVKDCARCHKKELMGNQLATWKKARHSKALDTLKSEEALKIAKEKGISKPPHEADECVRCHATAHGLESAQIFKKPLKLSDSVQCESCHGPGSGYRKKKIMSERDKSIAAGMWEPGKNESICSECHNDESPTWDEAKGFDFEASKKEIAHPIPEDVKGRYMELEKEARKKKGKGAADDDDEDDD
jgi:hypothetical protein